MKQQSFRLKPSKNHGFSGHQLTRDRRLRFTLNGREFKAYTGDTILTALMANGIFAAGHKKGSAIALDAGLQLCVKTAGTPDDVNTAMPMDRTLAQQGMALEIFGAPPTRLDAGFGRGDSNSLKIDLDKCNCVPGPLHEAPLTTRLKINLLVIGGGIAGMTAAVTAADAGKNVMLLERRGYLGGDAELFGYADGEDDPRDTLEALRQRVNDHPKIKVHLFAAALSVEDRKVTTHIVDIVDGRPSPALMRITARNIVIATGTEDKLPLFPGNRLPRIIPLTEAFHLATAYSVWRGNQTAIFTNTNIAYRFSGQAQNADAKFVGIYDVRTNRASRFIDIAKAGGQKVVNGARLENVSQNPRSGNLDIGLEPSHDGLPMLAAVSADQLITNDGWLPRLDLWRQAGGKVNSDGTHVEDDLPENVLLAGSCAGLKSHFGVQKSAEAAVGRLLLKTKTVVTDPQIDAHFETPEGPNTVSSTVGQAGSDPVYTSSTGSLVAIEPVERKGLFGKLFLREKPSDRSPIADRALSYADTLVLTQREILPEAQLVHLLRERAIAPLLFEAGETRFRRKFLAESVAVEVPDYIRRRFGMDAQVWTYIIESGIPVQTGVLLFPNTDVSDPMKAVGIIVGDGDKALIQSKGGAKGAILVARVGGQTSTIRIGENS